MSLSRYTGRHLLAANCLPMMEERVCILQVHFLLNQRNFLLHWLILKRKIKKGQFRFFLVWVSSFSLINWFISCSLLNPSGFAGLKGSTRSPFELLGEQTCTTFSSFCAEDRGICLKKPSKYLMLSSGSHHLGSITSTFEFLAMIFLDNTCFLEP